MNDQEPKEPSVLDYLLSKLNFRQTDKVELIEEETPSQTQPAEITPPLLLPSSDSSSEELQVVAIPAPVLAPVPEPVLAPIPEPEREPEPEYHSRSLPWRTFIALLFAFFAQFTLDPTGLYFGVDPGGSLRQTDFQ